VDDDKADLDEARRGREQAEAARDIQDAEVSALYAVWAEAQRAAENPGTAPGMPPVAAISNLDPEVRQLIGGLAALAAGLGRSATAPPRPDRAEVLKDSSRWRVLGPGVLIPPRMP
jgi:hypothetical protein